MSYSVFLLVILLTLSHSVFAGDIKDPKQLKVITASIPLKDWQTERKTFDFNGLKIAYWLSAESGIQGSDKETVVLIHGFPSAAWDWHHIWSDLRKDHNLVAMDLLGYGSSDKPLDHNYSLIEQADIVISLTQSLGIKRFHVLSHDYGVSVAQELLSRHEQAGSMGFLLSFCFLNGGAFPEAQNPTLMMKLLRGRLGSTLIKLGTKATFTHQLQDVFGPNTQPSPELLSGYWQLVQEKNGQLVIPQLLSYGEERHLYRDRWVGAMQTTNVPMRVIVGMEDEISGLNMLARYVSLIPKPDVVRLQNIGHYPQVEAPREVLAAYKAFLLKIR